MRHRKKTGRLNRNISWRKATLKSLANDLFTYQRIETTTIKAKALRSFAEPLITLAKKNQDSINARRQAFQKLCDKTVVKSLFDELAPLYKDIPGGYTRIMKLGTKRRGDGADMAIIELTHKTISDEKLLGIVETENDKKAKKKTSKKKSKASKDDTGSKKHSAPEVAKDDQEEKMIEDVKKSKAKSETKKVDNKGIFKRFRRKAT